MTATAKPWMPSETMAVNRSAASTTAMRPMTAIAMIANSCSGTSAAKNGARGNSP
ncbi:hypothetical protein D3C78_1941250 [compost metagenome]